MSAQMRAALASGRGCRCSLIRPARCIGLRKVSACISKSQPFLVAPAAHTRKQRLPRTSAAAETSSESSTTEKETESKSDEYTDVMQQRMGGSLTYRHELGMNWDYILPDLIVGSCLQTAADVDRLAEEGITTVFCLQEDSDMEYFNLDIRPIEQRCKEVGISHVRYRIRDFDPFSLRSNLPKAVVRLAKEHDPDQGIVYIHCTAGMGRAPGTALAYMYWLRGFDLDPAYAYLRARRACNPRLEAVRAATADMLMGAEAVPVTIGIKRASGAKSVQIAGLDVGWGQQVDVPWDPATGRHAITRDLLPGRYQYKLIIDGHWTYSADHPTMLDGGNINNYVDALGALHTDKDAQRLARYLATGGTLTQEERAELAHMLSPFRTIPERHMAAAILAGDAATAAAAGGQAE